METIAIPVWQKRISPVLDSAQTLMVLQLDPRGNSCSENLYLPATNLAGKVRLISEHGVDTVLCGAVSRVLLDLLERAGIKVIPWITGTTEEVLEAYLLGEIDDQKFILPGCGSGVRQRMRRQQRGRRRRRS